MKFGKRAIFKKRHELTSRSNMVGKCASVTSLRVLLLCILAVCVMAVCLCAGALQGVIDDAPSASEIDITPLGSATFVYDNQGNQIQKLTATDSNRLPVAIDQIPENLQNAFIAIEDERFYEHNGIDLRGILRATLKDLSTGNFSEGASTITQQLLKNNVFTNWTEESTLIESFTRKLQEQYLAVEVEKEVNDKSVILENYLNTINLGAGTYGVQAASQRYFGKDVWDLSLSECAVIAGITQNPTLYNPITNPEDNAERREEVLSKMYDLDYITKKEYKAALADDVYSRIQETEISTENTEVYSYFIDAMTEQVINDLQTLKGYSETDAYNKLYSGGLQIYTTQDPAIQEIVDEEYANPDNFPSYVEYYLDYALTVLDADGNEVNYSKEMMELYFQNFDPSFDLLFSSPEEGQEYIDQYKSTILAAGGEVLAESVNFTPQPQSSMTIIDQSTGQVKALIGGRGEKTASLTLNRATKTTRQPGSTFKIVSTYAPALDACNMSLANLYRDAEFTYSDGTPLKNSSSSYRGDTTIREAIQDSINVVAVKCLMDVTPSLGFEYLQNFGFTTIVDNEVREDGTVYSDLNESLPLGALTYGVTNIELCSAYAAIANGGVYTKPTYYTKILDADGNVLIDNEPVTHRVIKESTAWLLTSAMEDVVKKGTGTALQLDDMAVAGKTGTTDEYNDLWFVGYTPYYTCAVWSGYDNNEKLADAGIYRSFHKQLWQTVMSRIHEDLPYMDFQTPSSVEKVTVCSKTLKLPGKHCSTVTEYFDVANLPTTVCDGNHKDYYVHQDDNDGSSGYSEDYDDYEEDIEEDSDDSFLFSFSFDDADSDSDYDSSTETEGEDEAADSDTGYNEDMDSSGDTEADSSADSDAGADSDVDSGAGADSEAEANVAGE